MRAGIFIDALPKKKESHFQVKRVAVLCLVLFLLFYGIKKRKVARFSIIMLIADRDRNNRGGKKTRIFLIVRKVTIRVLELCLHRNNQQCCILQIML